MDSNLSGGIVFADVRSHCAPEGISTGHYVPIARMYQRIFADTCHFSIAGGPVYRQYFKDLLLLPHNVCGTSIHCKYQLFRNCISLFRRTKNKTIIIQQASDITVHLAIALFYRKTTKLFLIRYSDTSINSWAKRMIYSLCKKKVDGIICPNDDVGKKFDRPYLAIPDVIYLGNGVSSSNESMDTCYDFCILGRIAEEKGVVDVARWIANRNWRLVIAGKPQTEDLRNQIKQVCAGASNITLKLDYLKDDEYRKILSSSRYAFLNYKKEYSIRSSGVVYDTLFAGVPVIGTRCTALQFVEDNNVGYLYNRLEDIDDDRISKLLSDEEYRQYVANIEPYRDTHSKYKNQLIRFICY